MEATRARTRSTESVRKTQEPTSRRRSRKKSRRFRSSERGMFLSSRRCSAARVCKGQGVAVDLVPRARHVVPQWSGGGHV
eukprot:15484830-Alexandrium_andersonii.AAC.1